MIKFVLLVSLVVFAVEAAGEDQGDASELEAPEEIDQKDVGQERKREDEQTRRDDHKGQDFVSDQKKREDEPPEKVPPGSGRDEISQEEKVPEHGHGLTGIKPCSYYLEREKQVADEVKEQLKSRGTAENLSFGQFVQKVSELRKSKGWIDSPPCIPSYHPNTGQLYGYWSSNIRKNDGGGFNGSFRRFSKYLKDSFTKKRREEES